MKTKSLCIVITAASLLAPGIRAVDFQENNSELTLRTKRMEVMVKDARIIQLKSLRDGRILADRKLADPSHTAGLGCMTGQEQELSRLHYPWGEPLVNPRVADKPTSLYRTPNTHSRLSVRKDGNAVFAEWKGLTDGKKFYPDDKITLIFSEDANGALTIQGSGESASGGVFGLQVPIENLTGSGKFVLPTFGGIEYAATGKPGLMPFHFSTVFYEAPLMTFEAGGTALGLLSEDPEFTPFHAFLSR